MSAKHPATLLGLLSPTLPRATLTPRQNTLLGVAPGAHPSTLPPESLGRYRQGRGETTRVAPTLTDIRFRLFALTEDAQRAIDAGHPHRAKLLVREAQKLCQDIDLSAEAFPYLGVREGTVGGIPTRLLRVGFVGELGYEIHVPYGYGEALWDALIEAGQPEGIRPFGVEAQRVLRMEKGHIIVSQDTDGLTNVWEADMPWAIAKTKPFFVGGRSTTIMSKMPLLRKLVGFTLDDPSLPCPEECHLVIRNDEIVGRVTSAVNSPSVGKVVGLAYVHPDDAAPDSKIHIKIDGGRMIEGRVVKLPFYDPEGKRQEM